jgi:hypothetical protein
MGNSTPTQLEKSTGPHISVITKVPVAGGVTVVTGERLNQFL